jgi:recombination protein RecR
MASPSILLDTLVKKLSRLPGIGPKSASRLAFHLLNMNRHDVESLTLSMLDVKIKIKRCLTCGGISDGDMCSVCSDPARDRKTICVVAEPRDMLTLEATGSFNGLYHVLNGLISPLDGIGPDSLNIASLADRCGINETVEVILALNPTVEGDATSLYISSLLTRLGVRVTRIARGLPVGADIEFADRATIIKSIEGRSVI